MREIIFKGKTVDDGRWVEGNLVRKIDPLMGLTYRYIVRQEVGSNGLLESTVSWYKVFPDTVGQYTGIKDKNGKRIFEGDLVEPYDDEFDKAVIEFRNGRFCICYYGIPGMQMEYGWDETAGDYGLCDYEELQYNENEVVIGNIHDKD